MKTTWLLLLPILLLTAPAAVRAQFTYTTNSDGASVTLTGYTGPGGNVTIPTNINGLTVVNIGTNAFYELTNLTSIMIPGSVTNIGWDAFWACVNLTNAIFSEGIADIGVDAFYGTKLNNITIPNSMSNIESVAFAYCPELTNVTFPNKNFIIGPMAFLRSGLVSVTIPPNVTNLQVTPFADCTNLTSVTISGTFNISFQNVFYQCKNLTRVTISYGSTVIPGGFYNWPLTSVAIPNTVTNIGEDAFGSTSLISVTIPSSVTIFGEVAFSACDQLTNVYFQGNAPAEIDSSVFAGDREATIYYLPNTTGWSSTFAGLPAVLWNPTIQTSDGNFGVRSNQFGFNITGTNNFTFVVEASTNLANPIWTPIATNTLNNGSFYFSDPEWSIYSARFYQLSMP